MPLTPVLRKEIYLAKASGDYSGDLPEAITREEKYLKKIAENGSGGGGDSGTTNYNELENKPKINNIPLVGNKSNADLGIIIPDVSDFITDTEVEELLADYVTETVFDSTIVGFYTKSETDALLTTKADKSTTYTKSETDAHIAEKVAEIVADAPEDFDTLKEMSDWIEHHEESASAMNSAIRANTVAISGKVDKETGKQLSTEDYTTSEKTKLEGIETGANKTTADSALSSLSTNPVQNKVIKESLDGKVEKVSGKGLSTNDFTNADKTKLSGIEEGATKTIVDTELNNTSTNPVQNKAVQAPIARLVDAGAKNHATINNGSYTATGGSRSYKIPVSKISGTIVFYCKKLISSDTDSTRCAVEIKTSDGTVVKNLLLERNTPYIEMFTVGSSITGVEIYPSESWTLSDSDTITVEELMLCTAEEYEASPEFVPYAPTNRELYEMILALQNQNGG